MREAIVMERRKIITWLSRRNFWTSCLAGRDPNEVFAKDGLLDDLKKALSERILNAELDEHLEDERADGRPTAATAIRRSRC